MTTATRVRSEPSAGTAAIVAGKGRVAAGSRDSGTGYVLALREIFLSLVPIVVVAVLLKAAFDSSDAAFDFKNAYWSAGHRLLTGGNPYTWTPAQVRNNLAFVYPALSAVIFVPFALFSRGTGLIAFVILLSLALTPVTLWVLNVREWRIYGVTMLWLPVFACWLNANESIFLVLMVALVWRCRDRPWTSALLTAAAISLKPFIWPLALWLIVTRRWRASIYTVLCGVVLNVAAWSIVGFGEIHAYLRAASMDTHQAWRTGYDVAAFASHLGLSHGVGAALMILLAAALVSAIVYAGFVKHRDREALVLTIALMLVASPVVWIHYFALLLVPMAITYPRMRWIWAAPVLMWVCPTGVTVQGWQYAAVWIIAGSMLVNLARQART